MSHTGQTCFHALYTVLGDLPAIGWFMVVGALLAVLWLLVDSCCLTLLAVKFPNMLASPSREEMLFSGYFQEFIPIESGISRAHWMIASSGVPEQKVADKTPGEISFTSLFKYFKLLWSVLCDQFSMELSGVRSSNGKAWSASDLPCPPGWHQYLFIIQYQYPIFNIQYQYLISNLTFKTFPVHKVVKDILFIKICPTEFTATYLGLNFATFVTSISTVWDIFLL